MVWLSRNLIIPTSSAWSQLLNNHSSFVVINPCFVTRRARSVLPSPVRHVCITGGGHVLNRHAVFAVSVGTWFPSIRVLLRRTVAVHDWG